MCDLESIEPHCKDGDLPVIHPSEEILLLEQGQLDVLVESETIRPVSYTHLDVYKRQV